MDELEVFGLLVACLCHDLDHRGTNNSYQTKVKRGKNHIFEVKKLLIRNENNELKTSLKTTHVSYRSKLI